MYIAVSADPSARPTSIRPSSFSAPKMLIAPLLGRSDFKVGLDFAEPFRCVQRRIRHSRHAERLVGRSEFLPAHLPHRFASSQVATEILDVCLPPGAVGDKDFQG